MGKKEVKISKFADDTTLYTENPKLSTRKLLSLKNDLNNVIGYKINICKTISFLYNNDLAER